MSTEGNSSDPDPYTAAVAELQAFANDLNPTIRRVVGDFVRGGPLLGTVATGPSDELVEIIAKLRGMKQAAGRGPTAH